MYSGWSPFLRTKFWKKELVGSGEETSSGEKNTDGSGRTVDSVLGKRYGLNGRDMLAPAVVHGGETRWEWWCWWERWGF